MKSSLGLTLLFLAAACSPIPLRAQAQPCSPLWPSGPEVRVYLRDASYVHGEFLCVIQDSVFLRDAVRWWDSGGYTALERRAAFDRAAVTAITQRAGTHAGRGFLLGVPAGGLSGLLVGAATGDPGMGLLIGVFAGAVAGTTLGGAFERWIRVPNW
jgi:hypothetical protein